MRFSRAIVVLAISLLSVSSYAQECFTLVSTDYLSCCEAESITWTITSTDGGCDQTIGPAAPGTVLTETDLVIGGTIDEPQVTFDCTCEDVTIVKTVDTTCGEFSKTTNTGPIGEQEILTKYCSPEGIPYCNADGIPYGFISSNCE